MLDFANFSLLVTAAEKWHKAARPRYIAQFSLGYLYAEILKKAKR